MGLDTLENMDKQSESDSEDDSNWVDEKNDTVDEWETCFCWMPGEWLHKLVADLIGNFSQMLDTSVWPLLRRVNKADRVYLHVRNDGKC